MAKFDELELSRVEQQFDPQPGEAEPRIEEPILPIQHKDAGRAQRLLALLTDLSLLVAMTIALIPLLSPARWLTSVLALGGFIILFSYHYFVGCWLLWGKTIGGTVFDVKVAAAREPILSIRSATLRWAGVYLSLLTGGIGFLLAALPSRRSLPDLMSRTRCVTS